MITWWGLPAARVAPIRVTSRLSLAGLRDDFARCKAAQRAHGDKLLQLEAEGELLSRQLGVAQDQQARSSPH